MEIVLWVLGALLIGAGIATAIAVYLIVDFFDAMAHIDSGRRHLARPWWKPKIF